MAATVQIRRHTGATPTKTDITSGKTRLSTSDNHYTTETTNPIPVPSAGTKYSFWCVTRLYASTDPSGTINNIKWYLPASNPWTGVTMEVGQSSAYTEADGTTGDTGNELTDTNYDGGTLIPTDPAADNAFTYDSGSPLAVTGSHTSGAPVDFGNHVVYQLSVGTGAGAGDLSDVTVTWQYDET